MIKKYTVVFRRWVWLRKLDSLTSNELGVLPFDYGASARNIDPLDFVSSSRQTRRMGLINAIYKDDL